MSIPSSPTMLPFPDQLGLTESRDGQGISQHLFPGCSCSLQRARGLLCGPLIAPPETGFLRAGSWPSQLHSTFCAPGSYHLREQGFVLFRLCHLGPELCPFQALKSNLTLGPACFSKPESTRPLSICFSLTKGLIASKESSDGSKGQIPDLRIGKLFILKEGKEDTE